MIWGPTNHANIFIYRRSLMGVDVAHVAKLRNSEYWFARVFSDPDHYRYKFKSKEEAMRWVEAVVAMSES